MLTPVRYQKIVLFLLFVLLLVTPRGLFAQAKKLQTVKEPIQKKVEKCPCGVGITDLSDSERVAEAKISKALDQPTSFPFDETPLAEAIEFLKDFHKIEIHLDSKALEDAGIESDTPVTRNVKDITLRSALKLMLRDLDLTFIIKDEVLMITTPEEAEGYLVTRVYNVRSLVLTRDMYGESFYDQNTLIAIIVSIVAPETWVDVGGVGSISFFQGMLVISQTQDIHEEVTYILKTLCKLRARTLKADNQDFSPVDIYHSEEAEGKATERIYRALGEKTKIDFDEKPLSDAIAFLKDFHKIEIQLDARALEDAGIESDTPVTLRVKDITLQSALKLMLRELDLTYIIKDEVLVITTPEEAESYLQTRIYPVSDLIKPDNEEAALFGYDVHADGLANYGPLLWLISGNVAPQTWTDVGGVGSVAAFPQTKCLVVSQTLDVHEQVSDLLAKLRKIHKTSGNSLAEARKADKDRLTLRIYRLRTELPPLPESKPPAASTQSQQPAASTQSKPPAAGSDAAKPESDPKSKPIPPDVQPFFPPWADQFIPAPVIPVKDLVETITALVEPASWKNKDTYIRGVPGKLIIRQKNSVHKKIRKLLIELEAVNPPPGPGLYSRIPIVG